MKNNEVIYTSRDLKERLKKIRSGEILIIFFEEQRERTDQEKEVSGWKR